MEENKKNKKTGLVVSIILIIILVVALGASIYFLINSKTEIENKETEISKLNNDIKVLSSQNEDNIKEIETKNNQEIQMSDKTAVVINQNQFFFGYLENGNLFYYNGKFVENYEHFATGKDMGNELIKKCESISNIKRLKIFQFGDKINPTPVLITEDGKAYSMDIFDNQISQFLEEYEIENIIDIKGTDIDITFEIELKGGSHKTIYYNYMDNIDMNEVRIWD